MSGCIDDIVIVDGSFDGCISATVATIKLLDYLGFLSTLFILYLFQNSILPILAFS